MLVLTRKTGQKIIINDNIEVSIVEIKGGIVKLGVEAPKNVSIFREEVYDEIKKANVQSVQEVSTNDLESALDILSSKVNKKSYADKLDGLSAFKLNKK